MALLDQNLFIDAAVRVRKAETERLETKAREARAHWLRVSKLTAVCYVVMCLPDYVADARVIAEYGEYPEGSERAMICAARITIHVDTGRPLRLYVTWSDAAVFMIHMNAVDGPGPTTTDISVLLPVLGHVIGLAMAGTRVDGATLTDLVRSYTVAQQAQSGNGA